jgi:hypothetical protein
MISNDNVSLVDRAFGAIWNGTRGTALKALFADGFEFRNLSRLDDGTCMFRLDLYPCDQETSPSKDRYDLISLPVVSKSPDL